MFQQKNNSSSDPNAGLHSGHRERMRTKLKSYGDKVFMTHELLEMFLYHIIPYKDTNPTARRIMKKFCTLDGVAAATKEDFLSIEGVGERCADFLVSTFNIYKRFDESDLLFKGERKLTKASAAELFSDYFKAAEARDGVNKQRIVVATLDSDMRLISLTEPYELDFGSGAVHSDAFVDAAVSAHATNIIIAHNHPHGPSYPSPADRETNSMLIMELLKSNILLIENYVICGDSCHSMINMDGCLNLGQNDVYNRARAGFVSLPKDKDDERESEKVENLFSIFSLVAKKEKSLALSEALASRFVRLCDIFYSDTYVLKGIVGSETFAIFLKLFFALYVRQKSDRFVFGKTHTKIEIAEYFGNMLGYEPIEKVAVMVFDSRSRAQAFEFVTEGTVDSSNLPPRRLLEIAKRYGASGLALAHNHPSSGVTPSEEDISSSFAIKSILESAGIKFMYHYVVSRDNFSIILDENTIEYKKDLEKNI